MCVNKRPWAYDLIADFYEAEFHSVETDVAYFARHAQSGKLLVLGCGTGRIGRLLGPHRSVTGVDRSAAMLDIARRNAPDAHYMQGDITDFDLGSFTEIIVPNGVFNFLPTRADQHRCLACCARALPTGGQLVLDLPMPDFRLLGEAHSAEKPAWHGQVRGRAARRTREVRRYPARQRLELTERYYLDNELAAQVVLPLRLIYPAEVEWMLESCGFGVEVVHGNYRADELTDSSPRILARAIRL